MALQSILETFADETDEKTSEVDHTQNPLYKKGYQAALDEAALQGSEIDTQIIDAISDMSFGYAEAMSVLAASLQSLFLEISGKLLKDLATDLEIARISQILSSIAEQDLKGPVLLYVPKSSETRIRAALCGNSSIPIEVVGQDGLCTGDIHVCAGPIRTGLNTQNLTAEIRQILMSNSQFMHPDTQIEEAKIEQFNS